MFIVAFYCEVSCILVFIEPLKSKREKVWVYLKFYEFVYRIPY